MSMTTIEEPQILAGNVFSDTDSVFEPHPYAGRVYTPNYRTLCSIFPEELKHHMLHAGGRKEYRFPAVPKGQYALLRVYDTWTLIRDLSRAAAASNDEPGEGDAKQQAPVHCDAVAADLIRIWAQDAPGNASGAKPGITVIGADHPTQLELNQLHDTQTTYFRWLVMKADEFWITGKREYITQDHRRALRWLGSEDRDWYRKIDTVLIKRCPACAEEINTLATICKHCNTNLVKFYMDIQHEPTEEEDAGVWGFMQGQKARAAKAAQSAQAVQAAQAPAEPEVRHPTDGAPPLNAVQAAARKVREMAEKRRAEELNAISTEAE